MNNHYPLSPKFAGAVFFAIYALLFLLFTKYTLLSLHDKTLLPLLPSLLTAIITGAFVGAAFGNFLSLKGPWYRPFLIGVLLACFALLLASLAIILHHYLADPALFSRFQRWQDYFIIYGLVLLSLFLTIGLWLLPLTGLAAIYFNKHFFPGLLAAAQKRIENDK